MSVIRKASCNEQLYMDLQDFSNTYAIQYIMKVKRIESIEILEEAINKVINNNTGSNVYLNKNKFYLNDNYLKIEEIEDNSDDIYNLEIYRQKIDYTKESVKVYLIHNKGNQYLFFQLLHSVMDGKGCLLFVENVMNYLKGKELIPCSNRITDYDYVKKLKYNKNTENKMPSIINPNAKVIKEYLPRWKVIEIDNYVPSVISKLACFLNKEFTNDVVKYMIPTDIRRHDKTENYIGNLTLPVFLKVKDDDNYQNVNGQLLYSLKNKTELNIKHTRYLGYEKIPKKLRGFVLKHGMKLISRCKKFSIGSILSHLGRIDIDNYNSRYLEIEDFVSLPVHQPLGAFSIVLTEYNNKTVIAVSYFENQFEEAYIDNLCYEMKNYLSGNVYEFNNTNKKFKYNYIELLQKAFVDNSDITAVEDDCGKYTYSDLYKNIIYYLNYFKKNNIKEQDNVILYLDRGFEYISACIACVLSGVIFIPIDKTITKDRLNSIALLSEYKMIITDNKELTYNNILYVCNTDVINDSDTYNDLNIKFTYGSYISTNVNGFNCDDTKIADILCLKYKPDNVIYKIYTSGTTGVPKCVPIKNSNLNNYILWIKDIAKTTNRLVMPLFTSLSVDLTITSVFLPLICGGMVKAYREFFSQNVLKKILNDNEINVIKGTPTHFSFINGNKYDNKEVLIIGGEQLSTNMCESLLECLGQDCRIINEYGPTEATVGCTYYKYDKTCSNVVPIGKPVYNTEVLVYDERIINENNKVGELLVAGDSVFDGYLGIQSNCFLTINNKKYYRTGDAVYIKDGNLFYVERIDNQVKIRGNRVELDEIKNAIIQLDEVADGIVLYDNNLYAYVILNQEIISQRVAEEESITPQIMADKIKDYLRSRLPNYMIPYQIIFVDNFPILPGGKIDKKGLLGLVESNGINDSDCIDTGVNITYDDELLKILASIKSDLIMDKNRTLFQMGLESFDVINFVQIVVDKYISEENEQVFINNIISRIDEITLNDIEREIVNSGGRI